MCRYAVCMLCRGSEMSAEKNSFNTAAACLLLVSTSIHAVSAGKMGKTEK